ncbi:MAG: GGDEF domain-containing protein [Algicola sp.]|nr:GGDEF domain-containing protein [Algicola sp.]
MKWPSIVLLPLLLMILILCSGPVGADGLYSKTERFGKAVFQFENIRDEKGSNSLFVLKVLQDRQGYIWAATQTGLYRYDGYDFKVFIHDPAVPGSLASNYIQTLYQDSKGVLWVGILQGGLAQYHPDTESFTHFQHQADNPESLSNNTVTAIAEGRNGDLWIATLGGGLNRFNPKNNTFSHFRHDPRNPETLSDDKVYTVLQDSGGIIWAGTRNGGLNRLDTHTGKFKRYQHSPGERHNKDGTGSISHNKVYTLFEDTRGTLWVGTRGGGLNRFDRQTGSFVHFRHDPDNPYSIGSDRIWSILEDKAGSLWVGTRGGGLNRLDQANNRFYRYQHDPQDNKSLPNNHIYSITQDFAGEIWLGIFGGALSKFDPANERFGLVKHDSADPNSISKGNVKAILKDSNGILWVGTATGLNGFDKAKNKFRHYQHEPKNPASLSDNDVRVIFEDSAGALWVGTAAGGLNQFNPKDNTFVRYRHAADDTHSLSDDHVGVIHEDKRGNLWIGTHYGLNRFNPQFNHFTRFFHRVDSATSISHNWVNALYTALDGTLWVGTNGGGLNKFNHQKQTFTRYLTIKDNANSLSHNTVYSITQDLKGTLWIGTDGGLNRFDAKNNTFNHYRIKDGLISDRVSGVLSDKNGNLWLGLNDGLSFFDPTSVTIKNHIGYSAGCSGITQGAYFQASDGQLFFGGGAGYCAFYPDNAMVKSQPPKLVFSDFRLLNKPVPIVTAANPLSPLTRVINHTQRVTLSHSQNILSFEFVALHYADPERNQYKYKLEGFNQDWIDTSSKNRRATYTNLPAGDYTFRVKSSNFDNVWNEQDRTIELTIKPAPWHTWWAYSLYFLVVLGIFGSFGHQQIIKLQAIKKRGELAAMLLVTQDQERKVLSRDLHDGIGPLLMAIKMRLQLFNQQFLSTDSKSSNQLAEILTIVQKTVDDTRSLAKGMRPVYYDNGNIDDLIGWYTDEFEQSTGMKVIVTKHTNIVLETTIKDNLFRIYQEALNNAYKHANADTINVTLSLDDQGLTLCVADNGCGLGLDLRAKNANKGIGLFTIEERTALIKGTMALTHATPHGLILSIKVPSIRHDSVNS